MMTTAIKWLTILWTVANFAIFAAADPMLRPEDLRPGMKGYGLSVFQGTEPERFEVEVLGILKNAFPKQDMILIRCSGANLEKHKIIAGMSGSPIYVDGKLIGALAYGWGFENEPLAGVTPIHNMLADLKRPAATETTAADQPANFALAGTARDNNSAPRPLLTPLALAGFEPRLVERFGERLAPYGFLPTTGGGSGGSSTNNWRQNAKRLKPGSAIGVELIRGDFNAVGVGTVTWVGDGKVLAFGHPMFQAGQIEAPAVIGEVHTIMSSLERSFKLASGAGEVGALTGDWLSCIVADTTRQASMIPVSVTVRNRSTGREEQYRFEVIRNPVFSPMLAIMAVAQTINSAENSSRDTTVGFQLTATLKDRTVRMADTFFNPIGGLLDNRLFEQMLQLFATPFGHTDVREINIVVDARLARQTAEIKRAWFETAEVRRGTVARLNVALKPHDQPEIIKVFEVPVPTTESLSQLTVLVMGGQSAPPDIALPDSLADYLDALEKQRQSTDLVAILQTGGQGLQYKGKLLKQLPPSALGVLNDNSRRDVLDAADIAQLVIATDWVLTGQAGAQVPIRKE